MNKKIATIATALLLVSAPRLGQADEIRRPEQGDLSLSLGFPTGDNAYAAGAAGAWYMITESLNLGFNVGIGLNFDQPGAWDFLLAPAVRYYLMTEGRVAPFLLGQVNTRFFENPQSRDADANFGFLGALGVELWILSELSAAGWVGLAFDLYQGSGTSASIGTLTSGLTVNLYFDL